MVWYKIIYDKLPVIAANVRFEGQDVIRTHSFSVKDGKVLFVHADGSGIQITERVCYVDSIKHIEWIAETAVIELLENSGFMLEDGVIKKKSSVDWDNIEFGKKIYVMDTIYADECGIEVVPINVIGGRFIYIYAKDKNNLKMWYIKTTDVKSLIEAE